MASTFAHQIGFLYGTRLFVMVGAKAVYQDVWNASEFMELIEREKITLTSGATPFLMDTVNAPPTLTGTISAPCAFLAALGHPFRGRW